MNELEQRISCLEQENRSLREERQKSVDALEMAARLGRFDVAPGAGVDRMAILRETAGRLRALIKFKAISFYLVHPVDNSFLRAYCDSVEYEEILDDEVNRLIDDHSFAWILRRSRPGVLFSRNKDDRLLLRPMVTSSRIRGMFVGVLENEIYDIPDTIFSLLSIVLLSSASALESIETYEYMSKLNRELEKYAQQAERLYQDIFEKVPIGIFGINPEGQLLKVNPCCAGIMGFESSAQLMSETQAKGRHLYADPREWNEHTRLLAVQGYITNREVRLMGRDGGAFWGLVSISAVYDKNNKVVSYDGFLMDITESKQAEEELRYQKQLLETIINGTWDILSIKKPDHTVEFYNQAGYDLIGLPPEEVNGRKCFELLGHSQTCSKCPSELAMERKEPVSIEKYVPELGIYLDCRSLPVLDDEGNIVKIVQHLRDITDQKRAEEKIRLINQKLEKANAEKDKLFTIIAHDLKSPMTSVFSTSQILAQEAASLSLDDICLISAEMHKSMENTLALLDDLMQWARMSQGGMDFSPEECCLYELARSSLYSARDVAEKKNITIRCDIPQGLTVQADQPMINAVIRNLIFNAVKFTNRGGKISLTARETGPNVEICVQDDGIGMDESIMSKIFSLDKSKRQYGTDGEKGTGLGMILCREFVEKQGGKIWVGSEPGQGTKVCFTLPVG